MRPYEYVTSADKLAAIAREVEQTDAYALDLETADPKGGGSVDPFTGRIRIVSLNTGPNRYVIDLYRTGTMGPLEEAFKKSNAICVGQNLKFDQKFLLWQHGIEFKRLFDSFRASSILYAGLPGLKHDLWSIYKRELGEDPATEDLAASDWNGTLSQQQLDYAADDVDRLLRLREVMRPKLAGADLNKIAAIEFQAVLPEAAIELNGLRLDAEMWRKRTQLDIARARALAALLKAELPNPIAQLALPGLHIDEFNLDSPDQILKSLRMMGIKQKVKDPQTFQTSIVPLQDTKEMTLAMLADKWPILSKFIEYRGYAKNASAFGDDFLDNIHPETGRIHCQYHPYTDAGRYSCRSPNLQQVPRGKDFRECFRVQEDRYLAICDWSNIEMRLAAEISKDKKLIAVFNNDEDAHYVTAGLMTGKQKKDITKTERQQAKPVNFGFIYGMSAAKLVLYAKSSYGVNLTEGEAKKFRKAFFEGYSGIERWHNFALDSGKRIGETRTLWKRRRLIKDPKAHNEFLNSPVQGSGADGLKNSLRVVYDKLKKLNNGGIPLLAKGANAAMVHMVHDEILVEHKKDPELEKAAQEALHSGMIEGMAPMMPSVKTAAEVGGGQDWSAK